MATTTCPYEMFQRSETGTTTDFKFGTQLQTYKAHKVT